MLQVLGREIARVRLMGSIGTLAVTRRQRQSLPPIISVLSELQHSLDGDADDDPVLLLPVIIFKHGVKLEIIEDVHGVLNLCPCTIVNDINEMNWRTPKQPPFMV